MKSSYLISICLVSTIILTDCRPGQEDIIFEPFPIERELVAQKIEWIHAITGFEMMLQDSILYVVDDRSDYWLYIYNIKNDSLIASLIGKGKGPNEFTSGLHLGTCFEPGNMDNPVYITDVGRREILKVRTSASLSERKPVISGKIKIPEILSTMVYPLNDSILIELAASDSTDMVFYDCKKNTAVRALKPTKDLLKLSALNSNAVFNSKLSFSPDHERIVRTFITMKRVHVYNASGDLILVMKDKTVPGFDLSGSRGPDFFNNNPMYFTDAVLSNDYMLIINENRYNRQFTKVEMLLFDYSGKSIAKFKLDRFIRSFAMDWRNFRLYGFDPQNYEFVTYDLRLQKPS